MGARQPARRQHVRRDQVEQRLQRYGARAHLVGQCRDAQIDPLASIAVPLPVQRYVLPVLLEEDRRQQVRPRPAARCRVEGRRRLGDGLAVSARASTRRRQHPAACPSVPVVTPPRKPDRPLADRRSTGKRSIASVRPGGRKIPTRLCQPSCNHGHVCQHVRRRRSRPDPGMHQCRYVPISPVAKFAAPPWRRSCSRPRLRCVGDGGRSALYALQGFGRPRLCRGRYFDARASLSRRIELSRRHTDWCRTECSRTVFSAEHSCRVLATTVSTGRQSRSPKSRMNQKHHAARDQNEALRLLQTT